VIWSLGAIPPGRQDIAQREQVLLLDHLVGQDGDGLRRVTHRAGDLGAGLLGPHLFAGHGHIGAILLLDRIGRVRRIGWSRRDKTDCGERKECGRGALAVRGA
jgi:hypothetical protein